MGQILKRLQELDPVCRGLGGTSSSQNSNGFPDLSQLPPELGLAILSHLNPTDLCLAACVWQNLANDELLWHDLCKSVWGYVSVYSHCRHAIGFSYRRMFLQLDEASLTFNGDPFEGVEYLIHYELVDDEPLEIAKFLHTAKNLLPEKKREFLDRRRDVLAHLLKLQNFERMFLPNALRQFFAEISAPNDRDGFLAEVIDRFSDQFTSCNPSLGLSKDAVFLLCYSLIMLSVDLSSPHVKNKMSKREFIKNTCRATAEVSNDLAGHLYDNIYLIGHVAPQTS
ncbi:F-box only protein 8-like [Gigantopelta aegis]|uniref:F-box only protein 8-like n=1 Tax=Gigantopelta aegis TaxID=1735272 RepID=UPI001B88D35D|nr:F-box only protein 8-like [Gigantopelta aegis]XP_041359138.1 F-box only protein 8-like [Gigantopelta aegis]